MTIRNLQAPLTAAALAVLLAACGSGSGTGDSGGTGGAGVAPKDAGAAPAQNTPASAENAPAAGQQAAEAEGALIDENGIRGDVLLSMLDHRTCHHKDLEPASSYNGPLLDDAQRADIPDAAAGVALDGAPNYKLKPGQQPPVGMPGHDVPCTSSLYEYTGFNDGTATVSQFSNLSLGLREPVDPSKREIRGAYTRTQITVSGTSVTLGAEQQLAGSDGNAEKQTLVSASAHTFQTNERIPFGLVTEWRQGAAFNELMVLPGDNDRQAKLCWNTHTSFMRRLHCQVWALPDGWQRGKPMDLDDQYLVDDRSMYEGETGHLYWRGNADLPTAAAAAAAAPAGGAQATPATDIGTVPTDDTRVTPGAPVDVPKPAPAQPAPTPDDPAQPAPAPDAPAQPDPGTPAQPAPGAEAPAQPAPAPDAPEQPAPAPDAPAQPTPEAPAQPAPAPDAPAQPAPAPDAPAKPAPAPATDAAAPAPAPEAAPAH